MSVIAATAAIKLAAEFAPDIIGLFSKEKGSKVGQVANIVNSMAEGITGKSGDEAMEALSSNPEMALKFKMAVMADRHVEEEMRLADVANARDMQKAALMQDDLFSKRFPYYFATAWSLFAFIYIGFITFKPIPEGNEQIAYTILGFLLGTALASVFQYLFGSTAGSKNKTDLLGKVIK